MGDYNRTTVECTFDQLQPQIITAIRQYIEDREMGDIEPEILFCCETTSERKKINPIAALIGHFTGRFPHGSIYHIGIIVTPRWLIWATGNVVGEIVVVPADLTKIEVREYEFKHMLDDTGLHVFGFVGDSRKRAWAFIGLGQGHAAEKFEGVLREVVLKAQNQ
jgi:hypothetical protein